MIEFLYTLFWMAFCYWYADKVRTEHPGIDVEPILYVAGGFLFGIFSFLWCWNKKRNYNKYNKSL